MVDSPKAFTWQRVSEGRDEKTERAAVLGGWLIRSVWAGGAARVPGSAMIFLADPDAADPVIEAPVVAIPIPNVVWLAGQPVSLQLPPGTFTDPQGELITLSASLRGGEALPAWLLFNASTMTLSGDVPVDAESFGIDVTATNTSGKSTIESFDVSVPVVPPKSAPVQPDVVHDDGATKIGGGAIVF